MSTGFEPRSTAYAGEVAGQLQHRKHVGRRHGALTKMLGARRHCGPDGAGTNVRA